MEARLRRLNLSHYAATLRGHEIDDDVLKLMTVADLREAGLDAAALIAQLQTIAGSVAALQAAVERDHGVERTERLALGAQRVLDTGEARVLGRGELELLGRGAVASIG